MLKELQDLIVTSYGYYLKEIVPYGTGSVLIGTGVPSRWRETLLGYPVLPGAIAYP